MYISIAAEIDSRASFVMLLKVKHQNAVFLYSTIEMLLLFAFLLWCGQYFCLHLTRLNESASCLLLDLKLWMVRSEEVWLRVSHEWRHKGEWL